MDLEMFKNGFAIIGIGTFSTIIVVNLTKYANTLLMKILSIVY